MIAVIEGVPDEGENPNEDDPTENQSLPFHLAINEIDIFVPV